MEWLTGELDRIYKYRCYNLIVGSNFDVSPGIRDDDKTMID